MTDTARSFDSYMDTLLTVLDHLQPGRVFEWGTGKSTQVLSMYPCIKRLVSVEHDVDWYEKTKYKVINNIVIYQPDLDLYVKEIEIELPMDLIFIDGKSRNECMAISMDSLSKRGVVILHDAKRDEYQSAIKLYPYKIWTDEGHTVTMTFSKEVYDELFPLLDDLQNRIGIKS